MAMSLWDLSVRCEALKLSHIPSTLTAEGVVSFNSSPRVREVPMGSARHNHQVEDFLNGYLSAETERALFLTYEQDSPEQQQRRSRKGALASISARAMKQSRSNERKLGGPIVLYMANHHKTNQFAKAK